MDCISTRNLLFNLGLQIQSAILLQACIFMGTGQMEGGAKGRAPAPKRPFLADLEEGAILH